MSEPTTLTFTRRRLKLSAWRWHDPDARPLVLVHGGRDHARSWDRVAAAFPDRHVVAPDLRGHGLSGWAEDGVYALDDFIGDLVLLLDTLGLESVDLVGHSLGGNIAWRMAALFPERIGRLCIIEGLGASPEKVAAAGTMPLATRLREDVAATLRAPRRAKTYRDLAAAADRLREANPRLEATLALHLAAHGTHPAEGGVAFRHDPNLTGFAAIDLSNADRAALWRAIEAPVLLVNGADSWASDPAKDGRAAAFRDVRCLSIADAGHSVHHDQPDAFASALRAFLDDRS